MTSLSQDVEVLRTIPLFAKIEPSKLKLLAFTSERLEFMAGQELFHQGDFGDAAYIILDGVADVMVDTASGAVNSKDGFFHLVTQFPQIGIEVMHELASRLHDTTQALTTARARLNELDKAAGDSGR
ncbi:MAG: Crp/Fnr family transcriptional regulator [Geminicoccaceae bacterium]|nr:Crp/Fnr family transcriptional regulator [Geminicoccaceae bacterium]